MKQIISIFLFSLIILCCSSLTVSFADDMSGTCGDNMFWKIEGQVLTISGYGEMYSFQEVETSNNDANYLVSNTAPWYSKEITSIVIEDGIESIGDYAFANTSCNRVSLPNTLLSIGKGAFYNCDNLYTISIPDNVISLGEKTFYDCSKLSTVKLPDGLEELKSETFGYCTSIDSIAIPSSVKKWSYPFEHCSVSRFYLSDLKSFLSIECSDDSYFKGTRYLMELYLNGEPLYDIVIPEGVTKINSGTFADLHLKSVIIPQSVTHICSNAFTDSGCYGLKSIIILCDPPQMITDAFKNYSGTLYYPCNNSQWDEMERGAWSPLANWKPLHDWGKPQYKWTGNDSVTATRMCKNNTSHIETETVNTVAEITKAATYTEMGETSYTATFTNPAFAQQTRALKDIPLLEKKVNPMTVRAAKKTVVKYRVVKRKALIVMPISVKKAEGKASYKLIGGSAKSKKALKLNNRTGKITIKKGTKKGMYTIKVKVFTKGTAEYKGASVIKKVIISVN